MARPRNKIVDYLAYLAARVATMFVHMSDVEDLYKFAGVLARVVPWFYPRHVRIAREHLRRSFPDWPQKRVDAVARLAMRNLFVLGIEVLLTPRLITPKRWSWHIRLHNMGELLQMLLEQERGVILLTGHFGNWEIAGYMMAMLGFPSVSVARPLDNPYLNDFIMGVRERTGQSILFKKGATATIDDVLDHKGILCFIADQDAGRKGEFVDFFGRPASTYKTIALMAMRHQVPVVVGYAKRLAGTFQFEVGIQRIIRPADWADKDNELHWITQEYSRALEEVVRSAPEQYLWQHRRWKHRPDGTRAAGLGVA